MNGWLYAAPVFVNESEDGEATGFDGGGSEGVGVGLGVGVGVGDGVGAGVGVTTDPVPPDPLQPSTVQPVRSLRILPSWLNSTGCLPLE